jgi:succinyl-diaminopimelate desuccinylase
MGVKDVIVKKVDEMEAEIVTLLQEMIQIPSVNPPGHYKEISTYLAKKSTEYGFNVDIIKVPDTLTVGMTDRNNVLITLKGKGTGPVLILNAHLDTVPEDDYSNWEFPPFSGELSEGRIYGRGATDSKGRIAAYIGAALALKEAGIELNGDIIIAATCDEETGGQLGAGFILNNRLIAGDYALVEGYSQEIIRATPGMTQLRIIVHGRPAHAGFKWNGINAIEKMAKVVTSLEKLQEELMNEPSAIQGMRYSTINIGVIKGGTKSNVVPGSCEIVIDLRIIPEQSIGEIIGRIERILKELKDADSELDVVMERLREAETEPTMVESDHLLIETLQQASHEINETRLPVIGVMGQSDSRWFIKNGIPAINYGPGTQANRIHGYDEFMEVSDLLNSIKVLSLFCVKLVGVNEKSTKEVSNICK